MMITCSFGNRVSLRGIVILGSIVLAFPADGKNLEFHNQCLGTVWVGAQGHPLPFDGGFQLNAGETLWKDIAGTTVAARIWARTGCATVDGRFICKTGDCGAPANNFGVPCGGIGGQPPATLLQFNFHDGPGQTDVYDITNVDGHNIGIKIEPTGNGLVLNGRFQCGTLSCAVNISACPEELRITKGESVVACASICSAIHNANQREKYPVLKKIYDDQDTRARVCCACFCPLNVAPEQCNCANPSSRHCCSTLSSEKGGRCDVSKWPRASNGKEYSRVFKDECPDAYSWPFDNASASTCAQSDYRITFCPHLSAN